MAIEASRQLLPRDSKIVAFRFKDVFFHSVLTVPDANTDGADVHFFLRPLRESMTARSSTWSEFRLTSYSADAWRTHCTGLISTTYEVESTPVDGGREHEEFLRRCRSEAAHHKTICTSSADQQYMYEQWREIGWEFGPCFTRLDDLRYSDDLHCTANLTVANIAGLMKGGFVQDHLIHPTTLDGILQCALIGMTKGGSVSGMNDNLGAG